MLLGWWRVSFEILTFLCIRAEDGLMDYIVDDVYTGVQYSFPMASGIVAFGLTPVLPYGN